jgi:hypothetical protein
MNKANLSAHIVDLCNDITDVYRSIAETYEVLARAQRREDEDDPMNVTLVLQRNKHWQVWRPVF